MKSKQESCDCANETWPGGNRAHLPGKRSLTNKEASNGFESRHRCLWGCLRYFVGLSAGQVQVVLGVGALQGRRPRGMENLNGSRVLD